jgi:hypothetical protein
MKIKPALFFAHRWLGIGMCLLFALWFASGIVMMYVEYPELTEEERIENLSSLEFSQVTIEPSTALGLVNADSELTNLKLINILGRPAYEFGFISDFQSIVFADNGEIFSGLGKASALDAVRHSGFFHPDYPLEYDALIDIDQWTLSTGLNSSRPLHRIKLNDEAGTIVYVSEKSGQLVRDTNRREKFWNWLGSTIHWIYPTQLRRDVDLWIQVIIVLSLLGIFSVITGGVIGFMRIRISKPYRGTNVSPYHGIMKLHHIFGLLSLIFVSTFMFSGLMSMAPWGIFDSNNSQSIQVERYSGFRSLNRNELPNSTTMQSQAGIKELHWQSIAGEPYLVSVRSPNEISVQFNNSSSKNHSMTLLGKVAESIPNLLPDSKLLSLDLVQTYDDYYYSRHNRYRPLPVYRAKFDDDEGTWYHIYLNSGTVVNRLTSANRTERWIYNGLHSLDFRLLLEHRPLWDIVVISLSLLGLLFSITSIIIGWRRLVQ